MRPFSAFLMTSHARATSSASSHHHVAKDVRVASGELVALGVGDGGEVEATLLVTEFGVKEHLEEQVAQLLFGVRDERVVLLAGFDHRRQVTQRVEGLVGLLDASSASSDACVCSWSQGHSARSRRVKLTRSSMASPAVRRPST